MVATIVGTEVGAEVGANTTGTDVGANISGTEVGANAIEDTGTSSPTEAKAVDSARWNTAVASDLAASASTAARAGMA